MGIYAIGRLEFAAKFENEDPEVRASLIEAQTLLAYQKQLNNLSIQEGRRRKQREKDMAELKDLQNSRKQKAQTGLNRTVAFGSEFATERIQKEAAEKKARTSAFNAAYLAEIRKR
jgi:hypothetical protein